MGAVGREEGCRERGRGVEEERRVGCGGCGERGGMGRGEEGVRRKGGRSLGEGEKNSFHKLEIHGLCGGLSKHCGLMICTNHKLPLRQKRNLKEGCS